MVKKANFFFVLEKQTANKAKIPVKKRTKKKGKNKGKEKLWKKSKKRNNKIVKRIAKSTPIFFFVNQIRDQKSTCKRSFVKKIIVRKSLFAKKSKKKFSLTKNLNIVANGVRRRS